MSTTMSTTSLPPAVGKRAHVLFTLYVFAWIEWCSRHIVLCFCFACFRLVSCVPDVASFSGFAFLDCPSVFSNVYIQKDIYLYHDCVIVV